MRYLIVSFMLFASFAFAEKVSLSFDEVSLLQVARVVYGEVEASPVIFTPAALKAEEKVSLNLRGVESSLAIAQVNELMIASGFKITRKAGVVWIDRLSDADQAEFVYRPKYRSASYLLPLISGLFKQGAFSVQRSISTQQTQAQPQPVTSQQTQQTQATQLPQNQSVDSGTSAYSLLDKQPDVLIFKGDDKDLARFKKLIVQLDTVAPELLVKVMVYEVVTDKSEHSALSLALKLASGKFAISAGSATAGPYSVTLNQSSLSAIADALNSDSRFNVVSSPQLRVVSGGQAKLTVGAQTPVLGSTSLDKNGNAVQSVDYKPSGVILTLKPMVHDDVSEMDILQQISDFSQTTTGVNNSPTLKTRELSTSISLKDGDVIVLGGLDQKKDSGDSTGLAFLPSWLWAKSSEAQKTEILMFIEAHRL